MLHYHSISFLNENGLTDNLIKLLNMSNSAIQCRIVSIIQKFYSLIKDDIKWSILLTEINNTIKTLKKESIDKELKNVTSFI